MAKKINLHYFILFFLSIVSFTIVFIYLVYEKEKETLVNYLNENILTYSYFIENNDTDYFDYDEINKTNSNIEVFIFDLLGNSLSKPQQNQFLKTNYLLKPEYQQALENGYGKDIRYVGNSNIKTLFVSKLSKNIIIVLSTELNANITIINLLPLIFFYMIIIIYLFIFISQKISKKIIVPLENLVSDMNNYCIGQTNKPLDIKYEELKPLNEHINKLDSGIISIVQNINKKNEVVESILLSMTDGLIMLDNNFIIILANESIQNLLSLKNIEQMNFLHLFRNKILKSQLLKVRQTKENSYIDLDINEQIFRFNINSSKDEGYVIIVSDVTEIVSLENTRKEFTSNVTHELKTPLTSISGFAELINLKIITSYDEILNYSGKIFSESKRLIYLVEDILKLSDIENGEHKINENIELVETFNYVVDVLSRQIEEKNVTINISGNLVIFVSKQRLFELIFNLIDNAIKYNTVGGKINISIFESKNYCGFKVSDTGIGIPKSSLTRIFERFYRVDKARTRSTGGTGLGLSIVKHIVELYEGQIKVKSDCNGTDFIVYFPIKVKR